MLQTVIITALATNALFRVPFYQSLITRRPEDYFAMMDLPVFPPPKGVLQFKPFSCVFCLSFWFALIILVSAFRFDTWQLLIVHLATMPLATAFLAEGLNRLFNLLPVKL